MLLTSKACFRCLTLFIIFINAKAGAVSRTDRATTNDVQETEQNEILSRRKRFLIFPEGSSLQLVFCLTYPTIFAIGDIFLYGYTAALAWDLPQDPYSPFDHRADPLHRRMDGKNIFFTDYDGKILFTKPYKRKPIVNPAFAKRSVRDNAADANDTGSEQTDPFAEEKHNIDRKRMHAEQIQRSYLRGTGERSVDFHRISRADLYPRMESLFTAAGADGRRCTLRLLCESGRMQNSDQGSFVHEIVLAVFTLPKGSEFQGESEKEYDIAHSATGSCAALYPCDQFTQNPQPKVL